MAKQKFDWVKYGTVGVKLLVLGIVVGIVVSLLNIVLFFLAPINMVIGFVVSIVLSGYLLVRYKNWVFKKGF